MCFLIKVVYGSIGSFQPLRILLTVPPSPNAFPGPPPGQDEQPARQRQIQRGLDPMEEPEMVCWLIRRQGEPAMLQLALKIQRDLPVLIEMLWTDLKYILPRFRPACGKRNASPCC